MDEHAPGEPSPEPEELGTGNDVASHDQTAPTIKIPSSFDNETGSIAGGVAEDGTTVVLPSGAVLSVASDGQLEVDGVVEDSTSIVLPSGEVLNGASHDEIETDAANDASTVVLPSGAVLTGVATSGFETGLTPDSVEPLIDSVEAERVIDSVEAERVIDSVEAERVIDSVEAERVIDSVEAEPVIDSVEAEPVVAGLADSAEPEAASGLLDFGGAEPVVESALFDATAAVAPAVEPLAAAGAGAVVGEVEPPAEPVAGADSVVHETKPPVEPVVAAAAAAIKAAEQGEQDATPIGEPTTDSSPDHASVAALPAPSAEQIASLPAVSRRPGDVAMTPSTAMTAAAANQPIQVVIDPRLMAPTALPRSMQWSPAQVLQVLVAAGLIALLGLIAGWFYGGTKEAEYTARSEFIYFLEDALPDGFLREDRRILTQLVTIESETSLRPIAAEFGTTVEDLRKQLTVEVIDLSEVIRLDIVDADTARALAINEAVLGRYQALAADTDRRPGNDDLITQRDTILEDLQVADEQVAAAADAELSDVSLQLQEESLSRELNAASERVNRLSSIADGLLTETTVVDDRGSIESQISRSQQRLAQLEADLLQIRSERATLQQTIARQLASETPFAAASNQQRDVTLGVREDSVQLEIDTVSQRIRSLESALAESLLDTTVTVDGAPVEGELVQARQLVSDLEDQLLVVRTRRIELAQSAATRPSLLRTIERLEQDLAALDTRIADANIDARNPSPIEVLTEPVVLAEQANNPNLTWAALGMLASLPLAALIGAVVRQRQRKRA